MLISMINLIFSAESNEFITEINKESKQEQCYAQLCNLYLTEFATLQNRKFGYFNNVMFSNLLSSKKGKDSKQQMEELHTKKFSSESLVSFGKHLYECLSGIAEKISHKFKKSTILGTGDRKKQFIFRLKYGTGNVYRKGVILALNCEEVEDEKTKRKRVIGAIKIMLCDLYVTYYRLCKFDKIFYMKGERTHHFGFLQMHLVHFILNIQEKLLLLDLTEEELVDLEMMWTCNFAILQLQNNIHYSKMEYENATEHLCVSKNFITNKNSVTDSYLNYLYMEWDRIVCAKQILTLENVDEVTSMFDNAKCWLKVNTKRVKQYQEKIKEMVAGDITNTLFDALCDTTFGSMEQKEELFDEEQHRLEKSEFVKCVEEYYGKLKKTPTDPDESYNVYQYMCIDVYQDSVFTELSESITDDETLDYDPADIKNDPLSEEEFNEVLTALIEEKKTRI